MGNTSDESDLLRDCYWGIVRCDSALGNWASAFQHQLLFKRWDDSLQARSYNEQTAQMQTQFETVQKEAKIETLEKEQELSDLKLSSAIGIAVALGLGALVVAVLWLQVRSRNRQIQEQRKFSPAVE